MFNQQIGANDTVFAPISNYKIHIIAGTTCKFHSTIVSSIESLDLRLSLTTRIEQKINACDYDDGDYAIVFLHQMICYAISLHADFRQCAIDLFLCGHRFDGDGNRRLWTIWDSIEMVIQKNCGRNNIGARGETNSISIAFQLNFNWCSTTCTSITCFDNFFFRSVFWRRYAIGWVGPRVYDGSNDPITLIY